MRATSVSLLVQIEETLTFNDVLLKPRYSTIASRKDVDTTCQFSKNIQLRIPISSANMDTVTESPMAIAMALCGGIGIIHRFLTIPEQVREVEQVKSQKLLCGAAVGVVGDYLERCEALLAAGVDVLVVDVAHGHAEHVIKAVRSIKKRWPTAEVVAGNVATHEGVDALVSAGADGVKVGVGPGASCSTRIVTGCGVPQLSAILDTASSGVPIIADGGIRNSGDITKALAAGASSVMIGSLLAGSIESPGGVYYKGDTKTKIYRGMASFGATIDRKQKEGAIINIEDIIPEGVEMVVPCKGKAETIVNQLVGGLRSGLSYCGARNIDELRKNARFIKITSASWHESMPVEGIR